MENLLLAAIILALFAYINQIFLYTVLVGINPPILGGIVAGLVFKNVQLGLYIGTILTLMSLGMYTYGGAQIPDYFLGSILGTAVAALMLKSNPGMASKDAINVALTTVAIPAAMLGTALSSVFTFACTALVQFMEKRARSGDAKGYNKMYYITLILTNGPNAAIPVFLGVYFGKNILSLINLIPNSIIQILGIAGGLMPLMGFGLLLSMFDIKKYWPYLLIGYFLISYTNTSVIGLTFAGVVVAYLYYRSSKNIKVSETSQKTADQNNTIEANVGGGAKNEVL